MKEKYYIKSIFNNEIGYQGIFIAEKMTDKLIDKKEAVKLLNDYEQKIKDLEQEQIQEMQEHQNAMLLADKTIKETREKVVDEIMQFCEKKENDLAWLGFKKLNKILERVKGENNANIKK